MIRMSIEAMTIKTGADFRLPNGFYVGHAQDEIAATGCTVVMHKDGAVAGVSVRGAAPATLETDLLDPKNAVDRINAVVLSGGSAFGLEAASGVRQWLSERGCGFRFAGACIPIVCGASIFDLSVGSSTRYPDKEMGYAACNAVSRTVDTGNVGAGIGASVGKALGGAFSMKGGLGCASIELDGLIVSALVVVNAVGNIYDRTRSKTVAGVLNPGDKQSILDPYRSFLMMLQASGKATPPPMNTTISCIVTNGVLTKAQACHIADMAHDGYARSIEPVHTTFDGDTVFLLSSSVHSCSPDLTGILAAKVMEAAILDAVYSATTAYGLLAASDLL